MAAPTINSSTVIKRFSNSIEITTATTNENILGCMASSGQEILVTSVHVHNDDGTNAATFQLKKYNQDGTPMNSNVGISQAAIGADTVAGASLGGYHNISVAAQNTFVAIDSTMGWTLKENESLVFQASAANDLAVWLSYTVYGPDA